jgi:hypothetical protein
MKLVVEWALLPAQFSVGAVQSAGEAAAEGVQSSELADEECLRQSGR